MYFFNLTMRSSTGIKQGSYIVFSYLIPGFVVLGELVTQQIIPLPRSGAVWWINFKDPSGTFFFLALWGLDGERSGVSGPWGRGVSALKHVSTPLNISWNEWTRAKMHWLPVPGLPAAQNWRREQSSPVKHTAVPRHDLLQTMRISPDLLQTKFLQQEDYLAPGFCRMQEHLFWYHWIKHLPPPSRRQASCLSCRIWQDLILLTTDILTFENSLIPTNSTLIGW